MEFSELFQVLPGLSHIFLEKRVLKLIFLFNGYQQDLNSHWFLGEVPWTL